MARRSSDGWELAAVGALWVAIVLVLALGKSRKDAPPEPGPAPVELTPRLLAAALPDLAGREAVLKTAGFEATHEPTVFVWRPRAGAPPAVTLVFAEPPGALPPRVRGTVAAHTDGTPALLNCRPE